MIDLFNSQFVQHTCQLFLELYTRNRQRYFSQIGANCNDFKTLSCVDMEFSDMNLTKDSSLLLHAIDSLLYWQILCRKLYSTLVLKLHTKKSAKPETRVYS
jgi:hypothetical protein